jgi:hypothetical protein
MTGDQVTGISVQSFLGGLFFPLALVFPPGGLSLYIDATAWLYATTASNHIWFLFFNEPEILVRPVPH